jgi:hypothetical protein
MLMCYHYLGYGTWIQAVVETATNLFCCAALPSSISVLDLFVSFHSVLLLFWKHNKLLVSVSLFNFEVHISESMLQRNICKIQIVYIAAYLQCHSILVWMTFSFCYTLLSYLYMKYIWYGHMRKMWKTIQEASDGIPLADRREASPRTHAKKKNIPEMLWKDREERTLRFLKM